jgi:hypothetical protein
MTNPPPQYARSVLWACTGKQSYADKRAAQMVIERMSRRGSLKPRGTLSAAYRCTFCHGWHIGSGPRLA